MNSITLFNNTLIKLIARSGTESERQGIVLDVGEFGYTTDSKRLYVGDGVLSGGSIVGNVFKGSSSNILNLTNIPRPGDSAFDTSKNTLYVYTSGATNNIASWLPVGAFYTATNGTIVIDSSNQVRVGSISANNIAFDALGNSLTLSSGRAALSSEIAVDKIKLLTSPRLELPTDLKLGTQNYRLTSTVITDGYLSTDATGNLAWRDPSTLVSRVTANSATLTLGKGLTGTAGGVLASTFPISGNISITPIFAPTAHATFTQDGVAIRAARIQSITPLDVATALSEFPLVNGLVLSESQSRFDHPASGAYEIVTSESFDPGNVVIDVCVSNGIYRTETGEPYTIYSPTIESYSKVDEGSTNTIIVIFYSVATIINQQITGSRTSKAVLTPGTSNTATKFSVTVYG